VVVCVGESCTLPEAFALVVTVRVEDPAVAVIVTEVELPVCQLKVTLCPVLMEVELGVSVTVGAAGMLAVPLLLPQEQAPRMARSKVPQ
jgi:hypothetical protein